MTATATQPLEGLFDWWHAGTPEGKRALVLASLFSGFGAVTAVGRVVSAVAPFAVGSLAESRGFGVALSTCSVAFVLAAACWIWIPETRGRCLA